MLPASACLQVKEQEEKLRQQLADMRAKEAETGSDIPGLIQERDECRWVWGFASFSPGFREERELGWKAPGTVQQKPSFTSGRRRGLSCPTPAAHLLPSAPLPRALLSLPVSGRCARPPIRKFRASMLALC